MDLGYPAGSASVIGREPNGLERRNWQSIRSRCRLTAAHDRRHHHRRADGQGPEQNRRGYEQNIVVYAEPVVGSDEPTRERVSSVG